MVIQSTTLYCKVLHSSTTWYYKVLQSTTPVLLRAAKYHSSSGIRNSARHSTGSMYKCWPSFSNSAEVTRGPDQGGPGQIGMGGEHKIR